MRQLFAALALLAVAAPLPAMAQDDGQSGGQDQAPAPRPPEVGSVSGSVVDQSGVAIPHATVTLSAGETVQTDDNGQFVFATVPVGGYAVGVDMPGYQSIQISIRVRGNNDSHIDIALQSGAN